MGGRNTALATPSKTIAPEIDAWWHTDGPFFATPGVRSTTSVTQSWPSSREPMRRARHGRLRGLAEEWLSLFRKARTGWTRGRLLIRSFARREPVLARSDQRLRRHPSGHLTRRFQRGRH